jgi:hypothetical protein
VPVLSTPTAAALIEVVSVAYSHSELDVLFMRLDAVDLGFEDPGRRLNKLDRVRPVVEHLQLRDTEPNAITLLREIVDVKYKKRFFDPFGEPWPHLERLLDGMRNDGYDVVDGRLVATTPDPTALGEEISLLEQELASRGFDVALSHYQQAANSYVDGRLEASNGQLRSFLDDLMFSLTQETTGKRPADAKGAAEQLRSAGALDGDEARLIAGLAGVSNKNGAHAGLTDPDEARFRIHMTTAAARYLLARIPPPATKPKKARRRAS